MVGDGSAYIVMAYIGVGDGSADGPAAVTRPKGHRTVSVEFHGGSISGIARWHGLPRGHRRRPFFYVYRNTRAAGCSGGHEKKMPNAAARRKIRDFFQQLFGACRRRTPMARTDLKAPEDASCRDLSDATPDSVQSPRRSPSACAEKLL